jgi:predicted ribosome quality control (RQC) complex YloA/Tae2 family protein
LELPVPFDLFTVAAITDELQETIVGARVDRVIQPAELTVGWRVRARGRNLTVVASADPSAPRLYATAVKLAKAAETPSAFIMLLRKYCEGARISGVRQEHLERVVRIEMDGEHGAVVAVIEIMGRHSNVILVDATDTILGAVKTIGASQSRVRRVVPHIAYMLPPRQAVPSELVSAAGGHDRIDATRSGEARLTTAFAATPGDTAVEPALLGLFDGMSPSIASDIVTLSGTAPKTAIGRTDHRKVAQTILRFFRMLSEGEWQSVTFRDRKGEKDFRAYAEPPADGMEHHATMSEAIASALLERESVDPLQATRMRLRGSLADRRRRLDGRIISLKRELEQTDRVEQWKTWGDMVLGYQYQIEPGSVVLEIPELQLSIPLDGAASPVENAERYYKRYRKARDAGRRLPQLLSGAEYERQYVDELATYIDLAESPADLSRIRAEVTGSPSTPATKQGKRRPVTAGAKLLTVELGNSASVVIGRSARQNEEVTFRVAGRGDLWMHARDVPGAHVVLRGIGPDLDFRPEHRGIVEAAASLAAFYSKAREDTAVDVIVARARDIHHLPGGAPGQVTHRNGKTVRVPPRSPEAVRARR